MLGLLKSISSREKEIIQVEMFNGAVDNGDLLNSNCGADFVKVGQRAPENIAAEKMKRCVSVDGDADRVVFYYNDDQGEFRLLDGDRIATLIAGYIKVIQFAVVNSELPNRSLFHQFYGDEVHKVL